MASTKSDLDAIAEILKTSPKGSAKYKKAMKDLDSILEMPAELDREDDDNDSDDSGED